MYPAQRVAGYMVAHGPLALQATMDIIQGGLKKGEIS
jgi:hypothetical protein